MSNGRVYIYQKKKKKKLAKIPPYIWNALPCHIYIKQYYYGHLWNQKYIFIQFLGKTAI